MRHARTFLEHTLLNLLTLSEINEGLDKRETAYDILTQRNELFSRLALQKPAAMSKEQQRECDRSSVMYTWHKERGEVAHPPLRRAARHAAETPYLRPRGLAVLRLA